jgi:hypothetical protein
MGTHWTTGCKRNPNYSSSLQREVRELSIQGRLHERPALLISAASAASIQRTAASGSRSEGKLLE